MKLTTSPEKADAKLFFPLTIYGLGISLTVTANTSTHLTVHIVGVVMLIYGAYELTREINERTKT